MKRLFTLLVCMLGIHLYAADFAPFASSTTEPSMTMRSVNNSSYLSSGSSYSSGVYEVGTSAPSAGPRSVRKAPPGTGGESGYDPQNPQFARIGDAVVPLLLLALAYTVLLLLRYRRKRKEQLQQS